MSGAWSPFCLKCGARGDAVVRPEARQVFAGRLRPDAIRPFEFGSRVRCTKCRTWFTIGPGTEWREISEAEAAYVPEPDRERVESEESVAHGDD